jgi:hypothetical protein
MTNTTVHIWGRLDQTGHVSVSFADEYMSFKPAFVHKLSADIAGGEAMVVEDVDLDIRAHGQPVQNIKIDWLGAERMSACKDRIVAECASRRRKYNLFGTNCSSVAVELLSAGANWHFNAHKTMSELWSELQRRPFRHDHGRALEIIREVIEDGAFHCKLRSSVGSRAKALIPVLLCTDIATRILCWSPGDVIAYARELAQHNVHGRGIGTY